MRSRLPRLSLFLLPLLWLFRRALFLGETFAFRDAAFYYYPYYQYVQERWSNGIPLWNPLDGLGQPLLGDPTAAVLYPLKTLFWLPTTYAHCFAIYVVAHLLLAGFGTYQLARRLRTTTHGAILAGMAYQLSGQVLFQYCNPIYLVGAAWLPWGLLCFYNATRSNRAFPHVVGLSIVLSMMILGGDPQMAVHCVLCALVWCCLAVWRRFRPAMGRSTQIGLPALAGACLIALSLSAAQILPSQEWAARSDRANRGEHPRSILEVAKHYHQTGDIVAEGLWKRDAVQSRHGRKIYQFSVGPWRWSEFFWPHIGGRMAPVSTRWLGGLPGEGRMWVPSLYLGLLPILLALTRARLVRGSYVTRWISWVTLLSLLASMGEYGLGWIADELKLQQRPAEPGFQPSIVMRGFGGMYWFLTMVVPTYVEFRYPAKWCTITTLGMCLLAAKGWPLLWSRHRTRLLWHAAPVGLILLLVVAFCRFVLVKDVPATSFGPFDHELSVRHFAQAIAHSLSVATLCWILCKYSSPSARFAILALCAVELTVAQDWTILTVRQPIRPTPAKTHTVWRNEGHNYPASFRTTSSENRVREAVAHDLQTLMPKYHLLTGQRQLNSISSMRCGDLATILEREDAKDIRQSEKQQIRQLLVAAPSSQRARLAFAWELVEPNQASPPPSSPDRFFAQAGRDNYQHPEVEWTVNNAVGRSNDLPRANDLPRSGSPPDPNAVSQIISDGAQRIEVLTQTKTPALLVLHDQFYPGWEANITSAGANPRATPIHRVNRLVRGVFVPAGSSKIIFTYRPRSFYVGVAISAVAWISVLAYGIRIGMAAASN